MCAYEDLSDLDDAATDHSCEENNNDECCVTIFYEQKKFSDPLSKSECHEVIDNFQKECSNYISYDPKKGVFSDHLRVKIGDLYRLDLLYFIDFDQNLFTTVVKDMNSPDDQRSAIYHESFEELENYFRIYKMDERIDSALGLWPEDSGFLKTKKKIEKFMNDLHSHPHVKK